MNPRDIIARFDDFLAERKLHLEAVVIGGTALALLGLISRQTKDCDVLHPTIPEEILAAARAFAADVRAAGEVLGDDWLNSGPSSLGDVLPEGWLGRTEVIFRGRAIAFTTLGRPDLLRSKPFALCDRGIDLGDCLALKPSAAELDELMDWLEYQDGNPGWPEHVRGVVADLKARLGHGA
ncbi:MAG: hypothetical protein IT459_23015 [Planctomycetes bacterium]|nr:hypothetical protein [Planctomycetota bacterium]